MRYCFTATRKLRTHEQRLRIRRRLEQLTDGTEFTTGGAAGGDTYIAGLARALYPDAFHRIVLPKDSDSPAARSLQASIDNGYVRGEVIRTGLSPLKRNHVILDHGDQLEAFTAQATEPANARAGGGTWATWRYAGKRGMPRNQHSLEEE